ncbi:MAG: hypothetical protein JO022_10720 [Acidobacteriaceae bacterium]|nr:hypothetical protein [Acidobacteriaceae bacterium]
MMNFDRLLHRSGPRLLSAKITIRRGFSALVQVPIAIDSNGYLVTNGDFVEPVGPAFWERTTT